MHPRRGRRSLGDVDPVRSHLDPLQVRRLDLVVARVSPNELSAGVEDLEDHGRGRGRLQTVVEDRAARRIRRPRLVLRVGGSLERGRIQADRRPRLEQPDRRRGHPCVQLPQGSQVVEHPERSAVRRGDEIAVAHREVAHRAIRHVRLKGLPVVPLIEGDEDSRFGSGVEQPATLRILADDVDVASVRDAPGDGRPRLPAISRPKNVRAKIIEPVPVDRDERGLGIEVRGLDHADFRPGRQVRRRDVLPMLPAVARQPDQPVVRAAPDQLLAKARRRNRVDDPAPRALHGAVLRGHGVDRGRHAGGLARQVRADLLPVPARVCCPEEELVAVVEGARVRRREGERQGPLAAIVVAGVREGGIDVLFLKRPPVEAPHAAAEDDVGIARVGRDVPVLAAHGDGPPVALAQVSVVGSRRRRGRSAVLLRAVDPVRKAIVGGDVVELRGRLVVPGAPGPASVHADHRALIAAQDHAPGIGRIDPELVIVVAAGRALERLEGSTRVGRLVQGRVARIDDVGVVGVDRHAGEVPAALPDPPISARKPPSDAGVVGHVQAAGLRVHQGVDPAAHARSERDPDTAEFLGGQALGDRTPGVAAIRRSKKTAAGAVRGRVDVPRRPARLPQGGEDRSRVVGVEGQVDRPRVLAAEEDA